MAGPAVRHAASRDPASQDPFAVKRSGLRLLLRRAAHALANHGFGGVVRRAVQTLAGRTQPDLAGPGLEEGKPHPFDLAHGVETSGHIPGERLEGTTSGRSHAGFWNTAYYAISPSALRQALALLPEPAAGFIFVDLGCGKGRALLIARQAGFERALGIELSPDLVDIARRNTERLGGVEIRQGDAATAIFAAEPLVLFLYHPFLRPMLRRVLLNLQRQLLAESRPVYVLFANPGYQRTIRLFHWLEQVWDFSLKLSDEDAAADRHGITHERYTLYRSVL